MHDFRRRLVAASATLSLFLSPALAAAQEDTGLFMNILPPGNRGYLNSGEALEYLDNGTLPPNVDDQRPLYAALTYAPQSLVDEDLLDYFKPAPIARPEDGFGQSPAPARPGVSIVRDEFGVPHIEARRRPDIMYGIGLAAAWDRLFAMDLARRAGRGRLSEFVGNDPFIMSQDEGIYAFSGYDDADLQQQYDDLIASSGSLGKRADQDIENFVAGINSFITWVNQNRLGRAPAEYIGLEKPVERFEKIDILAVAVLLEFLFGSGGGGEHTNALLLQKLQGDLGATDGKALWNDLRALEEPESSATTDLSFPYHVQGTIDPDAVAMPDLGSVVSAPFVQFTGPMPAQENSFIDTRFLQRKGPHPSMSNFLAVTAQNAVGDHPILVGGPQSAYLVPELLFEFSAKGGGFHTRGVAPLGTPYVVLGRGRNYAWTATAGGSDNTDVRAEKLCEPDGVTPVTINSKGYIFNDVCLPMFERVDTWCVGPGQSDPTWCDSRPDNVTAVVQRTQHGLVFARATVGGVPVALVKQRTSFFKEGLNALAFQRINKKTATARTFERSISMVPGSFNWVYVNEEELFYYHSGLVPIRAEGVDLTMPTWGTGEWEWKGVVPASQHPKELEPAKGYFTSWNNKPARGWQAADSNYSFSSVHRVDMLEVRLKDALDGGPVSVTDMVSIMGDAAHTDLRGQELLPTALAMIGTEPGLETVLGILSDWVDAGAMRRDRDNSGEYDHTSAVAIMDAWFPEMIDATVGPQLSSYYGDIPLGFDDKPSAIGSAYQSGYYGIIDKTMRMAAGEPVAGPYQVLRCADGTASGCRAALVSSLQAAVSDLTTQFSSSDPANWSVDPTSEDIEFRAFGLVEVAPMPWQNRPTFQQVVQVERKK
ncbi:MAG TPA: penicillin acylase family protein [Candidatus Binatia bacterium]|nr:penicillin acylase family protein [Candidatus Binatia bacterium]